MPHDSVHTITGHYLYSTDKAIQFRVDMVSGAPLKTPRVEWFPLSQIEKTFRDPDKNDADWLIVSGWILEKKGIRTHTPVTENNVVPIKNPDVSQTHLSGGHFDAYDDDIPF